MITIIPVHSRHQLRVFLDLPQALYGSDPAFTPPLRQDAQRDLSAANPLWDRGVGARQAFVAYRNGVAVGRILAHVHHASNKRHGEQVGLFGMLAAVDDAAVVGALLDAAAAHHRAQGLTHLRGPYDLIITQSIGLVTAGFNEPAAFNQSWNPPYLTEHVQAHGLQPDYRAATYRLDDVQGCRPDTWLGDKHRSWLARPDVHLRPWDMQHFERDLQLAVGLTNAAFAQNDYFVPLSAADAAYIAGPMKRVTRPELTVFLEVGDETVGVGMFLPDFNVLFRRMGGSLYPLGWATFLLGARHMDAAVAQFIATRPDQQNLGLMRIVVAELIRRLQRAGFRSLDTTWVADSNVKSVGTVKAVGMRRKHALTVFGQALRQQVQPVV